MIPLSGRVKFIETESRMVFVRVRGDRGMGSYCLIGTEYQFCNMKSAGDGWW